LDSKANLIALDFYDCSFVTQGENDEETNQSKSESQRQRVSRTDDQHKEIPVERALKKLGFHAHTPLCHVQMRRQRLMKRALYH
jgi:hypothetical protein